MHHGPPRSIDVADLEITTMWSSYYFVDETLRRHARRWSWRWDYDVVVSFVLDYGLEKYPFSRDDWIWMMMMLLMMEGLMVVVAEQCWCGEDWHCEFVLIVGLCTLKVDLAMVESDGRDENGNN